MFLVAPVGVESLTLRRIPWASITLVGLMAVFFAGTWLFGGGDDALNERANETYEYWAERQHLELPVEFRQRFFDEDLEQQYAVVVQRARTQRRDGEDAWAEEQATLDGLSERTLELLDRGPFNVLALRPSRGLVQPGWLTHMFMHAGWMHLLGNLLFFYIVALLLEDIWGRWLFPAFFVVGGLIAAVAHFLTDPASQTNMVGASGAVAACMGAFAVRFATAKIRMGYFIWIFITKVFRGTFLMPAWILGLIWFGLEVLEFAKDGGASSGVAVMAHIGGFMFGSVFALGMKASGLEEKYLAHAVEADDIAYERDPLLDDADRARANGQLDEARALYQTVLRKLPDNVDAQVGLARLDFQRGQKRQAMDRVGALFRRRIQENEPEKLWPLVEELSDVYAPELLAPSLAKRVADELVHAPDGLHYLGERLYAAAGAATGRPGAVALLRAAEVAHKNHRPAEKVLDYLARARAKGELDAELEQKLAALEARARQPDGRSAVSASVMGVDGYAEIDPRGPSAYYAAPPASEAQEASAAEAEAYAPPPPPPPPPVFSPRMRPRGPLGAPKLHPCAIAGVSGQGIKVVSSAGAGTKLLTFGEVLAVAVGVAGVPQPNAPAPKQVLYTDLITSWGDGASGPKVLRVPGHALGLAQLYPALPMKEAYGEFLKFLLDRTGAHALPDHDTLKKGQYPRYADVPQMNAAIYERA